MLAEERLREGNVQESLAQLQEQVRRDPANAKHRIFLTQLLAISGEWERAINQLNVLGELDAGTLAMVQTYREAMRCEVFRADVFSGRATPLVLGKPERWMALLLEALRVTGQGNNAQAKPLREEAFELAPAVPGTIDGRKFEWIADADLRLGPVLEAVINGNYYWVPFEHIRELRIEEPADLRDFVWMPARFIWSNGGGTVGLIPTRYPGSESSEDSRVLMGRTTQWLESEPGVYLGLGQRILATDVEEYPLMNIRHVTLGGEDEADTDVLKDAAEHSDG